MNVLVCGCGKSGTTALFYAIARELEGTARVTFEPRRPDEILFSEDSHNLCKIVFGRADLADFADVLPRFDKRLFIVRDIRDVVVSRLLYRVRDQSFIHDPSRMELLMEKLARKEADPDAVGILELFALIGELEGVQDYLGETLANILLPIREWSHAGSGFHQVRYEHFICGEAEALNGYLGFAVDSDVEVPRWVRRVTRTKSTGDWRNWFTPGDIRILRPRLEPYLSFFGYDLGWNLPADRRIKPEHSSRYVRWIADLRRSGDG